MTNGKNMSIETRRKEKAYVACMDRRKIFVHTNF
jgi:hypothetical protein